MKTLAPAKINLGLRIVGVRPDGYHALDSLFLPLDLADALIVRSEAAATTDVRLQVDGNAPGDHTNLASRAARAFCEAAGVELRVDIDLAKVTPVAAGLGGGSSDAAAVLRALSQQKPGTLSDRELADVALGLGADVPFFLDPQPSRVRGIGEQLDSLPGMPSLALVLANPGEAVSTLEAYRTYDALGQPPSPGLPQLPLFDRLGGEELANLLQNDLEPAATRLCPAIARTRSALVVAGALAVGLSGSGATLYGICRDPDDARGVAERILIRDPGWCRVAITAKSR